ncbi:hypothetical protein [Microseira wollei]|uniref:hypothetical protein n=1 Tax=Microseira wollei TaxID=467598 RepID=UPI001CFCD5A2|nr:hypothetical protein [Microseira wollei]
MTVIKDTRFNAIALSTPSLRVLPNGCAEESVYRAFAVQILSFTSIVESVREAEGRHIALQVLLLVHKFHLNFNLYINLC